MTFHCIRLPVFTLAAVLIIPGAVQAKDCTVQDDFSHLNTGYCDIPSNGTPISGSQQLNQDPFYALDCENIANTPPTPVSGIGRLLVSNFNLDCNGPRIGTFDPGGANVGIFDVPERFTVVEERESDIVLDRLQVLGLTGTGPVTLGTLFDGVYLDEKAHKLVFSVRVELNPTLPEQGGEVENEGEFNFLFRSGFAGFVETTQAGASESRRRGMRLQDAAFTQATRFQLGGRFDPDTLRFQSDINVSELNPTSMFFYAATEAECHTVSADAIEINQAGQEGQPIVSAFVDGFVPAAACASGVDYTASISYPRDSLSNYEALTDDVTELAACTDGSSTVATVVDETPCVEVTSNAEVIDDTDPGNWPLVCIEYDVNALEAAEADLVMKKCESPGGDCCVVGDGTEPNACAVSCGGGSCAWDVGIKSPLSELADVPGDPTGRYCVSTPTLSEFSLATVGPAQTGGRAAQVPVPWIALGALAGLVGLIGTLRRRA